jgi:hypothetical protein
MPDPRRHRCEAGPRIEFSELGTRNSEPRSPVFLIYFPFLARVGTWRSLVAHLNGVQGVASSNLAVPTRKQRTYGDNPPRVAGCGFSGVYESHNGNPPCLFVTRSDSRTRPDRDFALALRGVGSHQAFRICKMDGLLCVCRLDAVHRGSPQLSEGHCLSKTPDVEFTSYTE